MSANTTNLNTSLCLAVENLKLELKQLEKQFDDYVLVGNDSVVFNNFVLKEVFRNISQDDLFTKVISKDEVKLLKEIFLAFRKSCGDAVNQLKLFIAKLGETKVDEGNASEVYNALEKQRDLSRKQLEAVMAENERLMKEIRKVGEALEKRKPQTSHDVRGNGKPKELKEEWLVALIQDFKKVFLKNPFYTEAEPEQLLLDYILAVHRHPKQYSPTQVRNALSVMNNFDGLRGLVEVFTLNSGRLTRSSNVKDVFTAVANRDKEKESRVSTVRTVKSLPIKETFTINQLVDLSKFIQKQNERIMATVRANVKPRILYDLERFIYQHAQNLRRIKERFEKKPLNDEIVKSFFEDFKRMNKEPIGSTAYKANLSQYMKVRRAVYEIEMTVKYLLNALDNLINKNEGPDVYKPGMKVLPLILKKLKDFMKYQEEILKSFKEGKRAMDPEQVLTELEILRSQCTKEWGEALELAVYPIQQVEDEGEAEVNLDEVNVDGANGNTMFYTFKVKEKAKEKENAKAAKERESQLLDADEGSSSNKM